MTTTVIRLLGPPEIHHHHPTTASNSAESESLKPDPLLNANIVDAPPKGLTENGSPTFLSSGDPLLDFFFQVVPDTQPDTITALLTAAWAQDPLFALKLACHLRGVRGTGKSDRKGFYAAALWLHLHHPKTLALNASAIASFGYLKDLLEILHRLIAGPDSQKRTPWIPGSRSSIRRGRRKMRKRNPNLRLKRLFKPQGTKEERIVAETAKVKTRVEHAKALQHQKRATMAARAVERYIHDPDYRLLHDSTSELFAARLVSDLVQLKSGEFRAISLAAKWCPSLDSSYDRSTLLCESVARRIFPREANAEYSSIDEAHYAYRVRDRLRREVLVPLRRALELPEVYISAGQWGSLPYNRVASVAMKNYKKLFRKHDEERFFEFLHRVREGKAKIAAGALLPHEILEPALKGEDYDDDVEDNDEDNKEDDEVAELQWRRMVSDLSQKGKLRDCIAVCDVSDSMYGTPMSVCVALGLLLSEISEEPWKGRVITFSERPELHRIEGESLREKASFVKRMEWGMNTNFQRVFDKILQVAVEGKLEPERMVKRVFVFSDMEFDMASAYSWETDYEAIRRKFGQSGYGSTVPEIVFWNLRDSRSTPVASSQKGVALVSGFSKNMMTVFLEGSGEIDPKSIMEAAIAGEEYGKLVVFD